MSQLFVFHPSRGGAFHMGRRYPPNAFARKADGNGHTQHAGEACAEVAPGLFAAWVADGTLVPAHKRRAPIGDDGLPIRVVASEVDETPLVVEGFEPDRYATVLRVPADVAPRFVRVYVGEGMQERLDGYLLAESGPDGRLAMRKALVAHAPTVGLSLPALDAELRVAEPEPVDEPSDDDTEPAKPRSRTRK